MTGSESPSVGGAGAAVATSGKGGAPASVHASAAGGGGMTARMNINAGASAPASTSAGTQATSMAGSPSTSSAGTGGMSGPTAGAMSEPTVDMACNPADKLPDAKPVTAAAVQATGMPSTGMFDVVVELDPGISDHTIWRPEPVGMIKHPILVWGMGACSNDSTSSGGVFSEMLREMASHGILVIADGTPGGTGTNSTTGTAAALTKAMDWAEAENERPCSKYYHKLNTKKIAVSGQSCGGIMAMNAATDPRVTVAIPFDSGLFSRDTQLYMKLHTPMAIVDAGPDDIAYDNGKADFDAIDTIPIMFANYEFHSSFEHNAGFTDQDNSGVFGVLAIAWLNWWLFDDMGPTGKGYFVGDQCGVCSTMWDIMWKMKPM
jgi:dienelactone hydrolase